MPAEDRARAEEITGSAAGTVAVGPFSLPLWVITAAQIALVITGLIELVRGIKGLIDNTQAIYTMDMNAHDVFRYQLREYQPSPPFP